VYACNNMVQVEKKAVNIQIRISVHPLNVLQAKTTCGHLSLQCLQPANGVMLTYLVNANCKFCLRIMLVYKFIMFCSVPTLRVCFALNAQAKMARMPPNEREKYEQKMQKKQQVGCPRAC